MKILVDEMPFFNDDCSFFKEGKCVIKRYDCVLTGNTGYGCDELKEVCIKEDKLIK